jgi:RND family efflux transporter MFP subunit
MSVESPPRLPPSAAPEDPGQERRDKTRHLLIPVVIVAGLLVVFSAGALLHHRAASSVNKVALSASPKGVSVVKAIAAVYRPTHRYVGTLRPWTEARVGPQFIAAYVNTVLVRPGAVVIRNQVLGTLDCRDASARSRTVDLQARGLQAEQLALSAQAQRMTGLLDGGYIAVNEVDQNTAQSNSEQARVEAERAKLVDAQLSVNDCILRAPFDGDIGERWVDPGAFVRPGEPMVSVVDRDVIRLVVDVPEDDFSAVAPGNEVQIHLLALDEDLRARISRRSPSADPSTRTIHTEIDLPNPSHLIPVNTTAEILVDVGQSTPATAIPLIAADISQDKARLFTVVDSVAHEQTLPVLGEVGGQLYFEPRWLAAGSAVVLEGRAALSDKDRVAAQEAQAGTPAGSQQPTPTGGLR